METIVFESIEPEQRRFCHRTNRSVEFTIRGYLESEYCKFKRYRIHDINYIDNKIQLVLQEMSGGEIFKTETSQPEISEHAYHLYLHLRHHYDSSLRLKIPSSLRVSKF